MSDPLMDSITRLIARYGRGRLFGWGLGLLCGLAAIAYAYTAVPREAFVERDRNLHTIVGCAGALLAIAATWRVKVAWRDAFTPAEHPICRGLTSGKLKGLQRVTGTVPGVSFQFDDDFQMLDVSRAELDGLVAALRERFPHVPVQEVAILIKKI